MCVWAKFILSKSLFLLLCLHLTKFCCHLWRRLVHHKTTTSPLLCGFNIAIFNQVSTAVVMWHVHSTVVHLYTWTQTTRTFPRIHPFLWGNASLKNTNTCEVANNTLHTSWPLLCGRDGRQSHGAPVPGYHTCTASQTGNSYVNKYANTQMQKHKHKYKSSP